MTDLYTDEPPKMVGTRLFWGTHPDAWLEVGDLPLELVDLLKTYPFYAACGVVDLYEEENAC